MAIPNDHPHRVELNDEAHARPPESLVAPCRVSYLALYSEWSAGDEQRRQLRALAARFSVAPPSDNAVHYSADFGPFRLKWERHTEFARYKIIAPGADPEAPFSDPALAAAPQDFIAELPGQVMAATHAALVAAAAMKGDPEEISRRCFAGEALVGAKVAGGSATAFTDYRIRDDGFSRLLVLDHGLRPRQAGRLLQRLLEIDTYRLMALLALPIARRLGPLLTSGERELAAITEELTKTSVANEPELLDRLIRLEAVIESRASQNHARFAAANAYHRLVQQRIVELREERLPALQTFHDFIERRLAPAMNTCNATAARQEALSARVSQATQLLSTRIDIVRERQQFAVLQSMNHRADLQLRLQQTVEGLSVAAVSYYIVGLIGFAAKGVRAAGVDLDPDLAMGLSIPFVVMAVAFGVLRMRKVLHRPGVQASVREP